MNGNPQSWFDLLTTPTIDPRSLIGSISFQDQGGALQPGTFTRSTNWLQAVTWIAPPMKVTPRTVAVPQIFALNNNDYASVEFANMWNGTHAMATINPQLPLVSEGLMFLKSGPFLNNIFLDHTGGTTSTDVQISFRDNSLTGGDFTNGGTPTIPVFAFASSTYGGTGRTLQITLLQTGHYKVGLRIVDNTGSFSMFPMDWIVL